MPKVIVRRGRIRVLEPVTPYDAFVRDFMQTMQGIDGVLVSGYTAILLGRSRQTEDIDLLVRAPSREAFEAWWQRLAEAGFWCLNAVTLANAWALFTERIAIRFAPNGQVLPNMEVKLAWDRAALRALDSAMHVDLLGVPVLFGDLSDQVAYKLYLGSDKDLEDARHISRILGSLLDWDRATEMAKLLELPVTKVQDFRRSLAAPVPDEAP